MAIWDRAVLPPHRSIASDRALRNRASSNGLRLELKTTVLLHSQPLSCTVAPLPSARTMSSRCGGENPRNSTSACPRSEEHTSELQSLRHLVCRLLLEKKKKKQKN